MSMTGLTPEQRRLVEQAGDRPVRVKDPEMHPAYVLIRADLYERVRDVLEAMSVLDLQVPEGIRRSQEAFNRDLPELLKDRRLRGKQRILRHPLFVTEKGHGTGGHAAQSRLDLVSGSRPTTGRKTDRLRD